MSREHPERRIRRALALAALAAALTLTSCASPQRAAKRGEPPQGSGFKLQDLAKADLDMVAEVSVRESLGTLRLLTVKLYRRNPREWRRGGQPGMDAAVARIFDTNTTWVFPGLEGKQGTDAIQLAFREDFQGDRVLAFMGGLTRMVMAAYNDQTDFYITDQLDPQRLYNAARNVEMAAWKLSHDRNASGQLFLVSNELDWNNRNLSFEREFGRLIGQLDLLSAVLAESSGRSVVKVVINLATGIFLPIPIPGAR